MPKIRLSEGTPILNERYSTHSIPLLSNLDLRGFCQEYFDHRPILGKKFIECEFFDNLTEKLRGNRLKKDIYNELMETLEVYEFQPGDIIIQENQVPDILVYVLEGNCVEMKNKSTGLDHFLKGKGLVLENDSVKAPSLRSSQLSDDSSQSSSGSSIAGGVGELFPIAEILSPGKAGTTRKNKQKDERKISKKTTEN